MYRRHAVLPYVSKDLAVHVPLRKVRRLFLKHEVGKVRFVVDAEREDAGVPDLEFSLPAPCRR